MKIADVLGMNTRNIKYLRLNKKWGKDVADSKIKTKVVLSKKKVPHPELLAILESYSDVGEFDWLSLKNGFVIKPSEGLGGEGILVVRRPGRYAGEWQLMDGKVVGTQDLVLHAKNIIEGQYSRNRTPDRVLIEERIKIHPKFYKYAHGGTPDVRVIVYNSVPVMAMLRLPTRESNGKANLHQGALGLGVDMATGITTHGVHYDRLISKIPDGVKKLNGLLIPEWHKILRVAVDAQKAARLGYAGIDIIIDEEKGPLVIELNDQPGLQIQLANRSGLHKRLRRVEDLDVVGKYKGVQIAQLLFAESFSDKVKVAQGRKILGVFEDVKLYGAGKKKEVVRAKIDTGAYSVSIDVKLAESLGLLGDEHILYSSRVRSALGREKRKVIELELSLQGVRFKALATVANRRHLKTKVLIGRRYLKEFLVDPSKVD